MNGKTIKDAKHNEKMKELTSIAQKYNVIPSACEEVSSVTHKHAIFSTYRGKGGSASTALTTGLIIDDYLHGGNPIGADFDGQMHMSHNHNRFGIPSNKGGKANTQRAFSYIKGMQKYPDEIEAFDVFSLNEMPIMDSINNFADDHGFKTGKEIRIMVGHEQTASEAFECARAYSGYKYMSIALRKGFNELAKTGNVYIDNPSAVLDRSPTNVATSIADHILMPVSDADGAQAIPDFITGMQKNMNGKKAVFEEYGANANGIVGKKPTITIVRTLVDLLELSQSKGKIYRGLSDSAKELITSGVTPDPLHAIFLDKVPAMTLTSYMKKSKYVKDTAFDGYVDNGSHKNVLMPPISELSAKVASSDMFNIFENWNQNTITSIKDSIEEYQKHKAMK